MDLIPGTIERNAAFPLSAEELEWLYSSNATLTAQEEKELSYDLPDVEDLMTPQQLAEGLDLQERLNRQLQALNASGSVSLAWKPNRYAVIDQLTDQVFAHQGDYQAETELRDALAVYSQVVPGWAVFAISDGKENGPARKQWDRLLSLIDETYNKAQSVLEKQLVSPIKILSSNYESLRSPFEKLLDDAEKHGHIKKGLFMSKEKKAALDAVTIGGHMPETSSDIRDILSYFEILSLREQLGLLWDRLIASHGARCFSELGDSPERSCYQQRKAIDFWVNWMNASRKDLYTVAEKAGLGATLLQPIKTVAVITDDNASEMLRHIKEKLVPAVNLLHLVNELYSFTHSKENTLEMVMDCSASATCMNLQAAINEMSAEQYELAVNALSALKEKASIQERRSALLQKISAAAPAWADAIRNRMECHGESKVPEDLQTAWKVRQLAMIVDEITATPLSEAEKRVTALTAQFRKETEKLAGTLAWMYLQQRIDHTPSMRQTLNGWKMTINKIGKGTGKRAPALRAEARKLILWLQSFPKQALFFLWWNKSLLCNPSKIFPHLFLRPTFLFHLEVTS